MCNHSYFQLLFSQSDSNCLIYSTLKKTWNTQSVCVKFKKIENARIYQSYLMCMYASIYLSIYLSIRKREWEVSFYGLYKVCLTVLMTTLIKCWVRAHKKKTLLLRLTFKLLLDKSFSVSWFQHLNEAVWLYSVAIL